ncbi:MAG: molybdopterin molybdotransferase MoeA [Acidimicrobiia bacterium]|nr:molybdopterin molybdotransferase MoeA [Acidimicrobiia bacterium]
MISLTEAQTAVLGGVPLLEVTRVPIVAAKGLVLAEDLTAPHDVPPFTNSAMDGYAVRAVETRPAPVDLTVIEDVAAGHVAKRTVGSGEAIKIMTGAPMPAGADAVVKVEDTHQDGSAVTIGTSVVEGENVRIAGGDLAVGSVVFEAGTRLTALHLGVLTSIGVKAPLVHRRPVVAVLSTGDEIFPVEADLVPGKIHDSNRPQLIALLDDLGIESIDLGIVGDDADSLRSALTRGAKMADVVLTSGGVSMGEYDLVKAVLSETGNVDIWRVAIKPAKPFAFGRLGGVPFFGLPGNPVSAVVAFEQFVRPALLKMMGARALFRPRMPGTLRVDVHTDPDRTVFLRMVAELEGDEWVARPEGGQSSNQLTALARSNAFCVVPVGTGDVQAGSLVELEMFRWPEARTEAEVLNVG